MACATGYPPPTPTRLIILRGNSGSRKSTIARRLQRGHGRGCALVEQDYLRRIVLRERDRPGGLAVGLIEQTARYALDGGYHVVLEGILHSARYGAMLQELITAHLGVTTVVYLDVSLDETLRRHSLRPEAADFTPEQMCGWYQHLDVLDVPGERILGEDVSQDEAVRFITDTAGLPLVQIELDPAPRRRDDRAPR